MQNALMNAARHIESVHQALVTEQELTEQFTWLLEHPDEFMGAMDDAYGRWDGEDIKAFAGLLREEVQHKKATCKHCGDTGLTTIRGMCGGVEMDCDDQPCPHCSESRRGSDGTT